MASKPLLEKPNIDEVILPALVRRGWDPDVQISREVVMSAGRVIVAGRHEQKRLRDDVLRADLVLFHRPNIPLAVLEAKRPDLGVGTGMHQALEYAARLDVPFAYSTNGSGFLESARRSAPCSRGRRWPGGSPRSR